MSIEKKSESELMNRAVSSKNLSDRADSNRLYGKNDFNQWVRSLLNKLNFVSVLDVCCGTGNQVVLYAEMPVVKYIAGIDISKNAIDIAKKRLKKAGSHKKIILIDMKLEDMFEHPIVGNSQFDLISCFYGLYYSQKVPEVLRKMLDHLSDKGTVLIVGPYGNNNANLFNLLQRHFTLPDLVIRSATTFMEHEVVPVLAPYCDIKTEYFLNYIVYPNPMAVLDYWKASTFYYHNYEDVVRRDLEMHFSLNSEFIVEKHIMACIAKVIR